MTATDPPIATLGGTKGPLIDQHDLLLLDLDGVVYVGPHAVPGAREALRRARDQGLHLAYVTNNASRPAPVVAAHLTRLGITAEPDEVVTSAMAGAALLRERLGPGRRVLVIGGEGLQWALEREGLTPVSRFDEEPDAVIQGFSPDVGWRLLAEGTRAIRSGLPYVATNTDLTVPTEFGPAPGNGTLVAAVVTASGVTPTIAGKPQPHLFRDAARRCGGRAPLVVGDRLDTDLEGARAAGMPGLAVLTGVTGAADLLGCPAHQRPTYLGRDLDSLFDVHPQPTVLPATARGEVAAQCRDAVVARPAAGGHLDVRRAGSDALDLLRAACACAWHAADQALPVVDIAPVVEGVAAMAAAAARPR